jgi:pilus assembly protein CpaC
VVKTLAEPNLIALSGDTASFLAGGEFPVPVAQDTDGGDSTVTVEFKDFGVSLAFTPTVLEDGLMNIVVSPEVSAIDPTTSTRVNGLVIPGLIIRRATTTVELRDGQAFAIAGLIQSDFRDTVSQLPWVGDIPVLGALFRSSEFQRDETELVIIVTPRLIQPSPAGSLAAPTDNFVPPSDTDLFLFGRLEAPESGTSEGQGGYDLSAQAAGGIEGTYGHIIK